MSSAEQQENQLRMQILQQQQRLQLQQLQRQQYRQLLHQQQTQTQQYQQQAQMRQQVQMQQQSQMQPYTSSSINVAQPRPRPRPQPSQVRAWPVSTTIATLEDALAYPEQQPQLAPLHKPAVSKRTPSQYNRTDSSGSSNNSSKPRKSVKNPLARKKFPRGLARFRDRLQHLEERLRLDVNALKQEIMDLQLRRGIMETRALTTRFSNTGSAAKIVREYFVTFHNGIQSVPDHAELLHATAAGIGINNRNVTLTGGLHESSSATQSQQQQPLLLLQEQVKTANRQNAFIEGLLDARMEFRKYVGRDVLREQWLRYSQCHAGLHMQLFSITTASTADQSGDNDMASSASSYSYNYDGMDDADASTVVHTTGQLTAYITQETLEQIFPNVLRNPGLAQRLLGAYIEYPFCIEFHVSADGKITKYDPDVDFVGALSKVLGNFEDVTLLMRDAVISDYCMIGALDSYPVVTYDASPMLLDHEAAQFEFEPELSDSLENLRTASHFVDKDSRDRRHETQSQPRAKSGLDYILS